MSVGLPIGCQSWRFFPAGLHSFFARTTDHLDQPDSDWFGAEIGISLILYHDQPHVFHNLAGLQKYLTRDVAWLVEL